MKAEDLMIGDWILCDGKPYQIAEIGGMVCLDADEELFASFEDIEPISLTSEILEKNGFENDFYEDVSVADYHSIRVEGYSLKGKVDGWDDFLIDFCNGSVNVVTDFHGEFRGEIGYVHTFQHALKLCGIEKEIVV